MEHQFGWEPKNWDVPLNSTDKLLTLGTMAICERLEAILELLEQVEFRGPVHAVVKHGED